MSSSMLSGERRWASARRGGMTVLGKVAVPKPINLPSQRLEKYGLDPNVEIVPKGTHSWGSKSSSSSSNAWGSSSLSPNTDGGSGSPSYLNGRPSSSGTGTRPSTAGSDRAHDPISIAWGSRSRPSSSSGVRTSNQTSQTTLRPRSAETRPGSSQLSRFAEPSDNSVAWGGSGTSEKLGVTSSKNEGFSLSTGDFPTLGSEKDSSGKNTDSQDHGSHGRPGSSTSGVASLKQHTVDSADDVSVNVNANAGGPGSWRKESFMDGEDGARPNVEKWHGDPQPYPNSNIRHSQHFDFWHGPHVNNHHPGGVMYRGPPGGPPFGSPIPPGGFPMEPFPYSHAQISPLLANAQPVRPPNNGPIGSHLNNGDMYRPHMHDPYVRPGPGMPLRPAFYPGPVPYDNYYGPPMGYCNSNDWDVPFMGMAMGPAGYNRYPGQNVPDPGNPLVGISGHGPCNNPMGSEQVEAVHPQDTRGPYNVPLKQHENWEGRDDEQKWDDNAKTNSLRSLKGDPPRKSSWENGWRTDDRMDDEIDGRRMILDERTSHEAVDNRAVPPKVKPAENVTSWNSSDESSVKKLTHGTSNFPEVLAPKDSSLIQKIEGLNAKARACDVRQDFKSFPTREEQKKKLQVGNVIARHPTNEAGDTGFVYEKASGSGIINFAPLEDPFSVADKSVESTGVGGTASARKSTHSRADHHGKMRFIAQEVDGRRQKTNNALEAQTPVSCQSEISYGPESNFEVTQNSLAVAHPPAKDEGEPMPHVSDVNESQRAKMNELAKRIKQREKQEEERTRDQRARALAKLEELNRRTQAGASVAQKGETGPSSVIQSGQESSIPAPLTGTGSKAGAPSSSLGSNTNAVVHNKKLETEALAKLEELNRSAQAGESVAQKFETGPSSMIQCRQESSILAPLSVAGIKAGAPTSSLGSNTNSVVHNKKLETEALAKLEELNRHTQARGSVAQKLETGPSSIIQSRLESSIPAPTGTGSKAGAPSSSLGSNTNAVVHNKKLETVGSSAVQNKEESSIAAPPTVVSSQSVSDLALDSNHSMIARSSENSINKVEKSASTLSNVSVETAKHAHKECVVVQGNYVGIFGSYSSHAHDASTAKHKRTGYRQKHNSSVEKNSNDNSTSSSNTETSKGHSDIATNATTSSGNIADEVTQNFKTNLSVNTSVTSESSAHHKKKSRNGRNRQKEDSPFALPPKESKDTVEKSGESVRPKTSETILVPSSVESMTGLSDSNQSLELHSSLANEEGDGRLNNQGKSQHPRRMMRNQQVTKSSDKPGKVHGSWRQRGVVESTINPHKDFQKSFEDHESEKIDESFVKEQPRSSDDFVSDGWYMPNEIPDSAVYALKDQGSSARGKRHLNKGHMGMGHNHNPDEKRAVGADPAKIYKQSTAPEVRQADSVAAKENHAVGARSTSHWQPKTQPLLATDQRGSQSNRSVNASVSEVGRTNKKESTHRGGSPLLPRPDRDTTSARSHQYLSEKTNFEEAPDVEPHQGGPKRERKTVGQRRRPISPVELSSHSDINVRHDQCMSGGLRRNGNANSRHGRERESHGEWGGSEKGNKQHNLPAAWERQKNNSHFEYQPVGPQNNKPNSFEPPQEHPHISGPRYRERGQSQSRRGGGNFSRRQSGGVEVDAGCE